LIAHLLAVLPEIDAIADLMPPVGLNNAAGGTRNLAAISLVVLALLNPRRIQ
jgi:hypothetical protein